MHRTSGSRARAVAVFLSRGLAAAPYFNIKRVSNLMPSLIEDTTLFDPISIGIITAIALASLHLSNSLIRFLSKDKIIMALSPPFFSYHYSHIIYVYTNILYYITNTLSRAFLSFDQYFLLFYLTNILFR